VLRPQVRPGLRRVWRDATTLQLGLCAEHGTVLGGLRTGDDTLIAALDGRHDLPALHALAREHSVPPSRVAELVDALADAGVLVDAGGPTGRADRAHLSALGATARQRLAADAEAWSLAYPDAPDGLRILAARAARSVLVDGAGRLGAAVAGLLAAAGVGQVATPDVAVVRDLDVGPGGYMVDDVGSTRQSSLAAATGRVCGTAPSRVSTGAPPDVVVLVRDDAVDARHGDDLVQRDLAHLAVVCGVDRVVVGPLVVPGDGPCLRCLDLHRRDRDPCWPHVAAQLVSHSGSAPGRAETALVSVAAGLAALQVLTHLDGVVAPTAHGRTLDVLLPDAAVQRRRWRAHPACGCVRLFAGVRENDSRD
jgi:hypothetical protein